MKMKASILDISEKDILTFTVNNINVSYANAIRRVILSEIPTVVFRTFPHEKNDAIFHINTGRLNNEILKQRLSCIPIHISNFDIDLADYLMEVDVNNTSETIIYVTTADFKIKNIKLDKYLSDIECKDIFPPDTITKQYIDFCRLRPKLSDSIPGEQLKMSCKFSIGMAKENGSFNITSVCAYANTPDLFKIEEASHAKKAELEAKYEEDPEEVKYQLKDWLLLGAKRITIPDSFDFKIETIGVFKNIDIVKKAIKIIINKLQGVINLYTQENKYVINSEVTIPNCFDIIIENEDFTIGKILEFTLYNTYYLNAKTITFCGFSKPHPHINISIIRIAFKEPNDKNTVIEYLTTVADMAIKYYKELLSELGETILDEPGTIPVPIPGTVPVPVPVSKPIKSAIKASTKTVKTVKPVIESSEADVEPLKPVIESIAEAVEPIKPVTEPIKPVTEPIKPATIKIKTKAPKKSVAPE